MRGIGFLSLCCFQVLPLLTLQFVIFSFSESKPWRLLSEICSGQRTRKIRFLTRFLRIIRTSTIISVTPSLSELHHQAFSAGTDEKLPCVSHILVALAFLLYCMQIMTHLSRILPNKPQSQSAIRN